MAGDTRFGIPHFEDVALDMRMFLTFEAVARLCSFTAAARDLDRGQPWVSEQIARLEAQLGQQLFVRSSRRVQLTALGQALLPSAREIAAAMSDAQAHAAGVRTLMTHRVRIGACRKLAADPHRRRLIEQFLRRNPTVDVSIINDDTPALLRMLRDREIDLVITFGESVEGAERVEAMTLARYEAQLLVPPTDPLTRHKVVTAASLAGRAVVCGPVRGDPQLHARVFRAIEGFDKFCVEAPESDSRAINAFATQRGLPSLRWGRPGGSRRTLDGGVAIPIVDPPISCTLVLARCRGLLPGTAADRVWRLARMLYCAPEDEDTRQAIAS
ncbi:LysR family transcriptional regulator [Sphingomonas immobilis]|uniref:LysR family transcriptional regulator n=1 Tax=Sphingomonas immobilis TaxID=3063997 RepID=A0ABT9A352_9SPHN|nr:LysR family transcriptional regulator [Sphingomonas sp. CA1-15]MDO7843635.1 LysR family transcriptional regulator [Sphingomonas sp. CA1-15]